VGLVLFASGCTDAATRVAYDIEAGTSRLGSRDGSRAEIRHTPKRGPEGCAGSYTLVLDAGAADALGSGNFRIREKSGPLHVRCSGADGNTHSWGTTYHLRFVEVPAALQVEKKYNEATIIEVERRAGKAIVTGLH
jgi:hypothetical protein